jgi:hypothetical protein
MLQQSWLVQILLPVADNAGVRFPDDAWTALRATLFEKFGGLTAYSRAPAHGVWASPSGKRESDDVFIVEVMCEELDETWWRSLQAQLEALLRQQQVVVRAIRLVELVP